MLPKSIRSRKHVEVGEFLTRTGFEHAPRVAGTLSLRRGRREPVVLGLLQEYVPNEGDAWSFTLDTLAEYFERGLAEQPELPDVTVTVAYLLELAEQPEPDERALEMVGSYLQSAETMGERTAQMHRALVASAGGDADFQPEAFSTLYQRSLYQSMRNLTGNVFDVVQRSLDVEPRLEELLGRREELLGRFRALIGGKLSAQRTRVHGDYHLGQLLFTGRDFVITDFEGEPARPASERRLKRSPLRDVAGMLRSFSYAKWSATRSGALDRWERDTRKAFLSAYAAAALGSGLFESFDDVRGLLRLFEMEKALYELRYEFNNRPDWLQVPLAGILGMLEEGE